MIRITDGDLDDPRVIDLLSVHVATARAATARGSAHALDVAGLRSSDVEFWAIWDDEELLGIGALKRLAPDYGEVKSMHTAHSARRRRGVGSALPRHTVAPARARGFSRLSLRRVRGNNSAPPGRSAGATASRSARRSPTTCPTRTARS